MAQTNIDLDRIAVVIGRLVIQSEVSNARIAALESELKDIKEKDGVKNGD